MNDNRRPETAHMKLEVTLLDRPQKIKTKSKPLILT
jgi:hypothetical protein